MSATKSATAELAQRYFDISPDLACVGDKQRLIRVNDRWREVLGWRDDEIRNREFMEFVHPDDVAATVARVEELQSGSSVVDFENRFATRDGEWRTLAWTAKLEPDSGLVLASARDVTAHRRIEQERDELNRMLTALSDLQTTYLKAGLTRDWWQQALDVLIETTGSEFGFVGRVELDEEDAPYLHSYAVTDIAWNEWSRQHYDAYQVAGMEFHSLETLFGATLSTGNLVISNSPSNDPRSGGLPEGHPPLLSYAGIPLLDADGMVGMIGLANRSGGFTDDHVDRLQPLRAMLAQIISRDVSSTKAETDPLTGLPNRAAFMKRIDKLLAQSNRRRRQFGVLLVDLDGFKEVNDSNGHLVGDEVLCEAANVAATTLRSEDLLARLGGDEFAVLLPDCDVSAMHLAGERLREAIGTITHGVVPGFGASVGGVVATSIDTDWTSLYLRADVRLYEAKRQGGNRVITSD